MVDLFETPESGRREPLFKWKMGAFTVLEIFLQIERSMYEVCSQVKCQEKMETGANLAKCPGQCFLLPLVVTSTLKNIFYREYTNTHIFKK